MGGPQDTFISGIGECMGGGDAFDPALALVPGMPNFLLGSFLASMAGIEIILDFLPPDPGNLPELPSLKLFTKPFTSGFAFDFDFPPAPGSGISVPGGNIDIGFDGGGFLGLFKTVAFTVLTVFTIITLSIIALLPYIPTFNDILEIFKKYGGEFGLPQDAVDKCAGCFVKGFLNLLKEFLPI